MSFDMEFLVEPDELPDDYEPQNEGYPECFELGGEAMAAVQAVMARAGVLDENQPMPELPEWPPAGLAEDRAKELARYWDDQAEVDQRLRPGEVPIIEAFRRACDKAGRTPSPQPGKVPAFKFETNDNWIVTPDECRIVAEGLDRFMAGDDYKLFLGMLSADGYNPEAVTELVQLWMSYNRVAADYGGYRVF